ncbi:hypothetical protein FISHEDRAFT_75375 [Fistulina hepatica ATCC 64428]|uniref:Arrestin-like N-terminal domain-containing protein n=1 Tax=Fistulina hepatica ATCC 64428 TaxID=1128425 RepID=A0A0D7A9P8_9AGAR|nr:hypothetical protein FISHEDRAFT_75375 [Fistulina hepatica ATCC 64428]
MTGSATMTAPQTALEMGKLPMYSPSPPPPEYNCEPADDEEVLLSTVHPVALPAGTFTKSSGPLTIVLYNQKEHADCPEFGRLAQVSGVVEIDVHERDSISDVTMMIQGQLETYANGCSRTPPTTLICETSLLWTADDQDVACPSALPFSRKLPSQFVLYDGIARPLPPSFEAEYRDTLGLCARAAYSITISVTRRGRFWTRGKTLKIPFSYCPRSRPHREIPEVSTFFASLKYAPDEWHQVVATLKTRKKGTDSDVACQFFMPAVKAFALSDTIPFHITLSGPPAVLCELHASASTLTATKFFSRFQCNGQLLRVHLLRQVLVAVNAQKTFKNEAVGEGEIWRVPPPIATNGEQLDWEGHVRVKDLMKTSQGSFNAGTLVVRYYVVFSVSPPEAYAPLTEYTLVRLTTDPYMESAMENFTTG